MQEYKTIYAMGDERVSDVLGGHYIHEYSLIGTKQARERKHESKRWLRATSKADGYWESIGRWDVSEGPGN